MDDVTKIETPYAYDLGSILIEAEVGFGRIVRITVNKDDWARLELVLEPEQARELGVHLMNAAQAAELATGKQ